VRVESRLSFLAVAVASTACAAVAAVGADARWLAAIGGVIVAVGHVPASIPYAAASSHGWANVPVLGELVFHWLDALGGDRALVIAQAVSVALALTLVLYDMRRAGASDAAGALVILAVPFSVVSAVFVVRAQLLSYPLFALTMLLLRAEHRRPSRRIWLVVPLIALWSNLHGAVLTGIAIIGVYATVDRLRRRPWTTVGVLGASVAALFATPALGATATYYRSVLESAPATSGFGLWAPLSLHKPLDVLFVAVLAPLLFFAWRSRPAVWEQVAIAVLCAATVHASRNGVWLCLFVAVPAAAGMRFGRAARSRSMLVTAAWIVPLVMLVAAFSRTPLQTVAGPRLREQAAELTRGAPLLADAEDAEQLALDGRRVWIANPIDAFDLRDQRLYIGWLEGKPQGDALLRRHRVVLVTLGSPAQKRLAHMRSFREVGRDAAAVLYRRVS
jgi:hypothetical protein